MTWRWVVVLPVLLGGCVSGPDSGPHAPQFVVESMKSRDELQQCLAAKLSRLGSPHMTEQSQARVVMSFDASPSPVTVVINDLDHSPYESTRSIEIWKAFPRDDKLGRDARSCI